MYHRATLIAILATSAFAGPLEPPVGPVAPSMKTLDEVEPRIAVNAINTPGDADSLFRITQSGSYYLTGNISGVAGKHGIELAASGITLDLNGFTLKGVPGSLDGVSVQSFDGQGVAIRNGSIRSWGDSGIEFENLAGHPSAGTISDIDASLNTGAGIITSSNARVERCTANENTGTGISVIAHCVIVDCVATLNDTDGITTNTGCTVSGSTASNNIGRGFSLGIGSTITGCVSDGNTTGFRSQASTYLNCNATNNNSDGFELLEGNTLRGCLAYRNAGNGFLASSANAIIDCSATSNELDGISVATNSVLRGNKCHQNGTSNSNAGIRATGADNRIEDNHCTDNRRGFAIVSGENFVARNTCSGSTIVNWDVAAGNACLIISATPTPGAVFGDSGGTSPGSTNPNANYTY